MGSRQPPADTTAAGVAPALGHPRAAQLVIGATQFMVLLDSLMVALALPVIDRELALTGTELPWVVNAYTLALVGLAARDVEGSERGVASSVFEVSIHIGGAFAIAILATTLAAVSTDAQDPAGYTAAWLAGAFMTVVGAVACAALLRPPGPELTSTNASRCP